MLQLFLPCFETLLVDQRDSEASKYFRFVSTDFYFSSSFFLSTSFFLSFSLSFFFSIQTLRTSTFRTDISKRLIPKERSKRTIRTTFTLTNPKHVFPSKICIRNRSNTTSHCENIHSHSYLSYKTNNYLHTASYTPP